MSCRAIGQETGVCDTPHEHLHVLLLSGLSNQLVRLIDYPHSWKKSIIHTKWRDHQVVTYGDLPFRMAVSLHCHKTYDYIKFFCWIILFCWLMVLFFWRSVEFKYQPRWQRLKVMVVAFFVYFFHFRFMVGSVLLIFLIFCVFHFFICWCFCFVCLRLVSSVPNVLY